jgi:hypothetical protein
MVTHEIFQLGSASLLPETPDVIKEGFHLADDFPPTLALADHQG